MNKVWILFQNLTNIRHDHMINLYWLVRKNNILITFLVFRADLSLLSRLSMMPWLINRKVINYAFEIRFIFSFWILLKQNMLNFKTFLKDYKASKQAEFKTFIWWWEEFQGPQPAE